MIKNGRGFRVTRIADEEYEDFTRTRVADLQGDNPNLPPVTLEIMDGVGLECGDEVELSAVIIAELTATNGQERHRIAVIGEGELVGMRQLIVCLAEELNVPASDHEAILRAVTERQLYAQPRTPRDEIRWWGDGKDGIYHAVEMGKPVRALCRTPMAKDISWTELVAEKKCCPTCLQLIDYGDRLARTGV